MLRSAGAVCALVATLFSGSVAAAGTSEAKTAAASPLGADLLTFPWLGLWETGITERDCGNGSLLRSTTRIDTVCGTGDRFSSLRFPGEEYTLNCIRQVTDAEFDLSCSGQFQPVPACTGSVVLTYGLIRFEDVIDGSGRLTVTYTGDCGQFEDSCRDLEVTATRMAEETACRTPVVTTTWSRLKTRYGASP